MPKIHEEILVVKVCRLVKQGQEVDSVVTDDMLDSIANIVEELAGHSVVVEVERA